MDVFCSMVEDLHVEYGVLLLIYYLATNGRTEVQIMTDTEKIARQTVKRRKKKIVNPCSRIIVVFRQLLSVIFTLVCSGVSNFFGWLASRSLFVFRTKKREAPVYY